MDTHIWDNSGEGGLRVTDVDTHMWDDFGEGGAACNGRKHPTTYFGPKFNCELLGGHLTLRAAKISVKMVNWSPHEIESPRELTYNLELRKPSKVLAL